MGKTPVNKDDDCEMAEHCDFTNAPRGTMYRLLKDKVDWARLLEPKPE